MVCVQQIPLERCQSPNDLSKESQNRLAHLLIDIFSHKHPEFHSLSVQSTTFVQTQIRSWFCLFFTGSQRGGFFTRIPIGQQARRSHGNREPVEVLNCITDILGEVFMWRYLHIWIVSLTECVSSGRLCLFLWDPACLDMFASFLGIVVFCASDGKEGVGGLIGRNLKQATI